jgi:uncharacterized repeat protein (TIGR03943 family)
VVKCFARWGGWGGVTLAAWSGLMLFLWGSGRLDLYLHPEFRPWVAVSGAILALMVVGIGLLPAEEKEDPPTGNRPGGIFILKGWGLLVLVIPAYAGAVLTPEGFSLQTVLNRGIQKDFSMVHGLGGVRERDRGRDAEDLSLPKEGEYSPAMAESEVRVEDSGESEDGESMPDFFQFVEKSPDGALRLEMLDLIYAAEMGSLRKTLEGKTVELTGQVVTKTQGSTAERFSLVRLLMVCCAADARPVGIWVQRPEGASGFQDMDWVRITGRPTFPVRDGRRTVVLEIDVIRPSEPPDELFLFQ